MLVALTTNQKLGLVGTAAVFIAFALVCALWIPRFRPDFPGRRGVGLFAVLTLLLTVAMLGAVVVFAKEDQEAEAAERGQVTTGEDEQDSEQGETNPTGQTTPTTTGAEKRPAGDPEAGKALFASNGCGSCHTFAAANASGTVGPNLDKALQDKDAEYVRRSIVEPNADVASGFQPGIMPAFDQLSDEQLDDLVAFLKT